MLPLLRGTEKLLGSAARENYGGTLDPGVYSTLDQFLRPCKNRRRPALRLPTYTMKLYLLGPAPSC